jgi:hypothetical protein
MSFVDQVSICRINDDLTIAPNEQEWRLACLQRPGMFGDRHIKQVLHPGKYSADPLARQFWRNAPPWDEDVTKRRALHVRKPSLARLANLSWQRMDGLDWTMYLPKDQSVLSVPVEIADDASLGYYNCRIIEPGDVISLSHRSIVVDFRYQQNYLQHYVIDVCGGCSIEHHAFAHVDMPLDEHSGHLVIGRIDPADQALELTAFVVRPFHRVYIPAKTIHTNDFLLGTWETLLSSYCDFPSAQLRSSVNAPPDEFCEHALPLLTFRERSHGMRS